MFTTPFTFLKAATSAASLPSGYTFYVDASDATSYPGTGTTWFDLSGNGYNMTLSSAGVFVNNGGNDKYMNFSNGIAKYLPGGTLSTIPSTNGEEGTWVFYTSIKLLSSPDYKTLIRSTPGGGGIHPVLIDGNEALGAYIGGFKNSSFDMTTISDVYSQPHMMAWKFILDPTGSPNWAFYYDSNTSSPSATLEDTPEDAGAYTWETCCIGAYHLESNDPTVFNQPWGKIWFAVYYPFLLSTAQLNQVNSYIAARY
jgi:hypothetical protein